MPEALGLPHCQATVAYPGRGYAGMLGWIQLVRSTDNASGGELFAMDPLALVGEVGHPFAFFGVAPTLFDAPARGRGQGRSSSRASRGSAGGDRPVSRSPGEVAAERTFPGPGRSAGRGRRLCHKLRPVMISIPAGRSARG